MVYGQSLTEMTFGQETRKVSQMEEQPRQRTGLYKSPEAGATWRKEVSVGGEKTGRGE